MKSIKQLVADLSQDDETVFRALLELQKRVNPDVVDDQIIEEFIQLLGNGKPMARESAAVALGNIGDPRAIEPLIKALGDSYDDYEFRVSVQAENSLVQMGQPAVGPLINALDDSNEHIRSLSIQALMRIGDKSAIKAIEEKLLDSSSAVREQAARVLGIFRDRRLLQSESGRE